MHRVAKTGLVLAFVLLLSGVGAAHAQAASALRWNYLFDEGAGTVNPDAEVVMVDGGTFQVPLNAPGLASIDTPVPDGPYFPAGELFFIHPDTEVREFVGVVGYGMSWEREGVYELDTYAQLVVPTRSLWDRFFAWVAPVAHAAIFGDYVETIRFEIVEGPIPEGPCCSSVLFLPGIKGSALQEGENTLWPPSVWSEDIQRLALTEAGESVNEITVAGVLSDFYSVDVYGSFATFMDALTEDTGDGTIHAWEPFAYDWRLSPEKTLEEGVLVMDDGEIETVDLIQTLENLASESKTGKVTIVAHSMGGLLGKALIQELQNRGQENLVDTFVMVGTPQLGTPQGVASLLHGDDEGILGGIVVDADDVRQIGQNMESAHNLLPSARYFGEVSDPVITFDESASYAEPWRNQWGSAINTYEEFTEFITGQGVARTKPAASDLAKPEILRPEAVSEAEAFHSEFDAFVFPDSIRVIQVAGWGLTTLKSIEYENKYHFLQGYEPKFTREGDKTVVYPSAVSADADETYFFNLSLFNKNESRDAQHKDLLGVEPTHQVVESILKSQPVSTAYVSTTKPSISETENQLLVSSHSPVILGAYDSQGNFTGIKPNQDPSTGLLLISEEIPGSTFVSFEGDQYIFLPKEGSYTFEFKGTGSGPTTIETSVFSEDIVTPIASYTDIPVTSETEAMFTVDTNLPQNAIIEIDTNGDGEVTSVAPDGYVPPENPSVELLVSSLKTKVEMLDINAKLKLALLKKIGIIEKKIEKQKEQKSKKLENLERHIVRKTAKGKIDTASSADMVALIDALEAQNGIFPLDPILVADLKEKVTSLSVQPKIKEGIAKKVSRLEKMTTLIVSLERLEQLLTKKGVQGKIPDADAQELLSLLSAIESAL